VYTVYTRLLYIVRICYTNVYGDIIGIFFRQIDILESNYRGSPTNVGVAVGGCQDIQIRYEGATTKPVIARFAILFSTSTNGCLEV
jgi:hypothetical protein